MTTVTMHIIVLCANLYSCWDDFSSARTGNHNNDNCNNANHYVLLAYLQLLGDIWTSRAEQSGRGASCGVPWERHGAKFSSVPCEMLSNRRTVHKATHLTELTTSTITETLTYHSITLQLLFVFDVHSFFRWDGGLFMPDLVRQH